MSVCMMLKVDCAIEKAVTAEVTEETFVKVPFADQQLGTVEKAENSARKMESILNLNRSMVAKLDTNPFVQGVHNIQCTKYKQPKMTRHLYDEFSHFHSKSIDLTYYMKYMIF